MNKLIMVKQVAPMRCFCKD